MANYYHSTANRIGRSAIASSVTDVARMFGEGSILDYGPIQDTSATAFTYFAMPSGPRTMLNYITSFGVTNSSSNTNSGSWPGGFDPDLPAEATPINTNNYFDSGVVDVIKGDGSADSSDWVVFYFKGALGDFDGFSNNAGNAWILGENTSDAATNGATVSKARIWGFGGEWTLLWEMTAGGPNTSTGQDKNNTSVWNSGGAVASGNGKRSAWDSLSLTHFGFSVGTV